MWSYIEEEVETFEDTVSNCVLPSLDSLHDQIVISFLVNFVFNIAVRAGKMSENMFHFFSMICGIIVLYIGLLNDDMIVHLILLLVGYIVLIISFKLCRNPTYMTEFLCIIYLIWGEFYYPNEELWLRSRGIAMIAVMKTISMATDFRPYGRPSILQYAGYLFCPANCMLGPWMTYGDYVRVSMERSRLNCKWMLRIIKATLLSFFCLSVSNCFAEQFIISDNEWVMAYKKALVFRTSHYFVSYLSEAVMLTGGYNERIDEISGDWSYTITNPFYVELPRSLSTVVVYWNTPMHRFLKMYIYIIYLPYSNALAILFTYFFSALLHGFNLQIALVLLSLGGFSYVQGVTQMLASRAFSACVKVRRCTNCQHRFKTFHPITLCLNFFFMIFNVANLIYLGGVMNLIGTSRSAYDTFMKWEQLGFSSHHIFFMGFCILWLFKGITVDPEEPAPVPAPDD